MNLEEIRKRQSEGGKKGAAISHAKRYEVLKQLSGYTTKTFQNELLRWPTRYLEDLLDEYQHGRS